MLPSKSIVFLFLVFLCACTSKVPGELAEVYPNLPETIDFNFHVQHILSDKQNG